MDTAIEARGLALFVRTVQREISDERLYNLWLHKVFDGTSYNEYRRKSYSSARNASMTDREQAGIISESLDILDGFDPEGV